MILSITLALLFQFQQPSPRPLTVVQGDTQTSEYEHDLWMEYAQLISLRSPTPAQEKRLVAIVDTLGTIPGRCTVEQAWADLCIRVESLKQLIQ